VSHVEPPRLAQPPVLLGSFAVAGEDPLHALIRAARGGDPRAVSEVIDRTRGAAPSCWPRVTDAVVVPVPGHVPGAAAPLLLAVARELADARGWTCADDALRRRHPAPEAKSAPPREPGAEAGTLEWRSPPRGRTVVLVDDVVRTGATLAACVAAIRAALDDREVVAVVLAAATDHLRTDRRATAWSACRGSSESRTARREPQGEPRGSNGKEPDRGEDEARSQGPQGVAGQPQAIAATGEPSPLGLVHPTAHDEPHARPGRAL
jgi:Phosphoribosyl transferase domain